MSAVISEDTMAWARDLVLIRKLLAGEQNPPAEGAVVLRLFGQVAPARPHSV
jgi:hypothetical protein